jgi:hypothetical protein
VLLSSAEGGRPHTAVDEYVHIDEFCVCVFASLLEIGKKSILCLDYLSSKPDLGKACVRFEIDWQEKYTLSGLSQ